MAKFFINRPIVAIVISIIMVIVGVVAILGLPIAQYPNIVPPEIVINTTYVGADAQTVEQSVATPIEQEMSGVDNMNYMYSLNANNGELKLYVNFDVKTDPNIDQVLAQIRKSQADSKLPQEVRDYGVTVKKSTASPLMLVSLYSPKGTYDATFLANYAYINLNDQITRVPGIASVTVFGAGQYAMRFWVKPDQLAKLNITIPEIVNAIRQQNTVNPAGQIGGEPAPPGQEFTYAIKAQGRLETEEEFGKIVLRANPDGSFVRLKDVARIELGSQTYAMAGRLNGKPSAVLALYQLPGTNAIQAVDGVKKLMEEAKQSFPPDLDYEVSLDTTFAVREGIKEVLKTLYEAMFLVIIVVFIFLQGWRATLIPALAVPVSLIGTFAFFPLLGFSINTIALMGLVLAIGLVVDDAIVVVEAVEHHIEKGLSPKEATAKAMEEVSGPVVAIALVLSAVFLPSIFIPGITGRLFSQFAVTIAISVLISAFNALTLSPALSAMILKPKKAGRGPLTKFYGWFNRVFGKATNGYVRVCGAAHPETGDQSPPAGCHDRGYGPDRRQGAGRLPAGGGPGVHVRRRPAAGCGFPAADGGGREPDGKDHHGDAGRRVLHGDIRLQHAERRHQHVQRVLLHHPQTLGGTEKTGGEVRSHHGPPEPGVCETPAGSGLCLFSPGHPRHRHRRRRDHGDRGSGRQGHRFPVGEHPEIPGRGAQAARAGPRHHDLHSHRAPDLRQCGPRQGAQTGGGAHRCVPNAADLHGRLLRQLLQPVWPPMAGLRAGRGRVPDSGRAARAVLRAQQQGRHGAPLGADEASSSAPVPNSPCVITSIVPRRSTHPQPRATVPSRR